MAPGDGVARRWAGRLTGPVALAVLSAAGLALMVARQRATGSSYYDFLAWNLLLAWIPLGLAVALAVLAARGAPAPLLVVVGLVWLAFLPNAPYLVTDLLHLRWTVTRWPEDPIMLVLFAVVGLLLGLRSLQIVHGLVEGRVGRVVAWAGVLAVSAMVAVGIYLGRVLRWNSWDVVRQPSAVAHDVWERVADPLAYERSVALTLLVAAAFALAYAALHVLVGPPRRRPQRG